MRVMTNLTPPTENGNSLERAVHGEKPPAIDREAVLANWRRLWRVVLQDLTPLQRRALELEIREAQS